MSQQSLPSSRRLWKWLVSDGEIRGGNRRRPGRERGGEESSASLSFSSSDDDDDEVYHDANQGGPLEDEYLTRTTTTTSAATNYQSISDKATTDDCCLKQASRVTAETERDESFEKDDYAFFDPENASSSSSTNNNNNHHHERRRRRRRSFLAETFLPCDDDTPQEVQLFHYTNLAIPASYLAVGTMQGLFRTFLNVYPLDLGATEAQQTTFATIATLPATFKVLYGFTTDNVPLFGYRRKPYIFLGWFLCSCTMLILLATSDLTLEYDDNVGDGSHNMPIPPEHAPGMTFLSIIFFLFGICLWFADATADAVVAEKARCEPDAMRGAMQSSCYAARFFGLMVAAPVSTYLYAHVGGPKVIITIIAAIPWLLVIPLIYYFQEERYKTIQPVADQCREIWKTICSASVWEPMAFIYLFNLLQVPNAAWRQFLSTVLGFTAAQLNMLLVASYVLLFTGTMVYKTLFLHASWRRIYLVCIILNGFFSSLQLLLIQGDLPFGMDPFWFALGDDAFAEFLSGIQFLPTAILMVALCPVGSEGASYAMLTTLWNSAQMLSPAASTMLLGIWDVSKEALEAGDVSGIFNLSLLTTAIQLSPVVFLGWMPHGRDELYALADKSWSGSATGGSIFLFVLIGSMMGTLTIALLNIVHPGWDGGS